MLKEYRSPRKMPVKQLISKQEKPQKQRFTQDFLTAASNKKQVNNYGIMSEIFVTENIFQIINVLDDVI